MTVSLKSKQEVWDFLCGRDEWIGADGAVPGFVRRLLAQGIFTPAELAASLNDWGRNWRSVYAERGNIDDYGKILAVCEVLLEQGHADLFQEPLWTALDAWREWFFSFAVSSFAERWLCVCPHVVRALAQKDQKAWWQHTARRFASLGLITLRDPKSVRALLLAIGDGSPQAFIEQHLPELLPRCAPMLLEVLQPREWLAAVLALLLEQESHPGASRISWHVAEILVLLAGDRDTGRALLAAHPGDPDGAEWTEGRSVLHAFCAGAPLEAPEDGAGWLCATALHFPEVAPTLLPLLRQYGLRAHHFHAMPLERLHTVLHLWNACPEHDEQALRAVVAAHLRQDPPEVCAHFLSGLPRTPEMDTMRTYMPALVLLDHEVRCGNSLDDWDPTLLIAGLLAFTATDYLEPVLEALRRHHRSWECIADYFEPCFIHAASLFPPVAAFVLDWMGRQSDPEIRKWYLLYGDPDAALRQSSAVYRQTGMDSNYPYIALFRNTILAEQTQPDPRLSEMVGQAFLGSRDKPFWHNLSRMLLILWGQEDLLALDRQIQTV